MADSTQYDPARSALLLMDFQHDIVGRGGAIATEDEETLLRIEKTMDAAARAAEAARKQGMAVIHVAVGRASREDLPYPHMPLFEFMLKANALIEGTPGFDFHPKVRPASGEKVIIKRGVSALAGTELGPWLRGRGIDTLALCGYVTHMVVVGTAREAADYGYRVVVLEDGCTSGGMERHHAAIENLRLISIISTTGEFAEALG